ncbi:MAG: hypothetical protein JXA42_01295 [Anaerolineales bacterium]|nr:hypothetical protein [Anaerolineales bacterium]
MKIDEYPRPHNDNGIGFAFYPDVDHTGRADLDRWLPRLLSLGASWLVVHTTPTIPIPDSFLQRLMMEGIEPVVMIREDRIGSMNTQTLAEIVTALADSGVNYVVLYDRPNVRANWTPGEWAKPKLVERFVDFLAPALKLVADAGMIPVLPPLEPFGEYWDTAFLQTMLTSLKRRGFSGILKKAAVGIRNFANNRELDWGRGGRDAWPQWKPYAPMTGGQDHRGFRLFEWYQPIIKEALGHEMPLITCANGPQSGLNEGGNVLDQQIYTERVKQMAQTMIDRELPSYVLNHAFWLLSAERNDPNYSQRWFNPDGTPVLPAVSCLENLAGAMNKSVTNVPKPGPVYSDLRAQYKNHATRQRVVPTPVMPKGRMVPKQKSINHYLLLPTFEWGAARWYMDIVQEYVAAVLPTVGFSIDEAGQAERVTIVGNEQGVDALTEQKLRDNGCQVERIAGKTGQETQLLLQQLARNAQRSQ